MCNRETVQTIKAVALGAKARSGRWCLQRSEQCCCMKRRSADGLTNSNSTSYFAVTVAEERSVTSRTRLDGCNNTLIVLPGQLQPYLVRP
jgi:hypothetical protein